MSILFGLIRVTRWHLIKHAPSSSSSHRLFNSGRLILLTCLNVWIHRQLFTSEPLPAPLIAAEITGSGWWYLCGSAVWSTGFTVCLSVGPSGCLSNGRSRLERTFIIADNSPLLVAAPTESQRQTWRAGAEECEEWRNKISCVDSLKYGSVLSLFSRDKCFVFKKAKDFAICF